ncbi:hypothetical protein [Stenotrophomonas geniculata]|nr:hypothetical protein [Stenotrophomonas geniculata]CAH0064128.1 protein of unknown function [Stenotrophomonas maltophilia]
MSFLWLEPWEPLRTQEMEQVEQQLRVVALPLAPVVAELMLEGAVEVRPV